jgi:hypothetical protein
MVAICCKRCFAANQDRVWQFTGNASDKYFEGTGFLSWSQTEHNHQDFLGIL